MADTFRVDADDGGEIRAIGADHGDVANVSTELDAVLDEIRDIALTGHCPDDFADTSEHNELAVGIKIARVAGMQPAIDDRLVAVAVAAATAVDHRDGAHENFAAVVDPYVNPRHRASNRMKLDMTF